MWKTVRNFVLFSTILWVFLGFICQAWAVNTGEILKSNNAFKSTEKFPDPVEMKSRADKAGCVFVSRLNEQSYWFYELQGQVVGNPYNGLIRSKKNPKACYILFFKIFYKNRYPSDPEVTHEQVIRTFGYLDAMEKWAHYKKWPEKEFIKKRLKKATRKTFNSPKELKAWLSAHEGYLIWSDDKSRMIFNLDRKRINQPYPNRNKRTSINTSKDLYFDYLWAKERGFVMHEWLSGEFLKGDYFVIDPSYQNTHSFQIPLSILKENHKEIKETLMDSVERGTDYFQENPKSKDLGIAYISGRLRRFTGHAFTKPEDWVKWFKRNKNYLELLISHDGITLVSKK